LRVVGTGKAAIWALFAAAVAPEPVAFEGKIEGFTGEIRISSIDSLFQVSSEPAG